MSAASRTWQGNSAAERNLSALQLPGEGKATVGIITWSATFSSTPKKNPRENTCVGFSEGERVFAQKWVMFYVQLGRIENIQKHETND